MTNLRFSPRRAFAVLRKEFIQLRRDPSTLRLIILVPIMQLLLLGYALNNNPQNLPTAVISQDNSAISRAIVAGLHNTNYFAIDYDIRSDDDGRDLLQSGKVFFVITIPNNFERDMIRGAHPTILIEADATDPVAVSGAEAAANAMMGTILSRELRGPLAHLASQAPAVNIETHQLYNPEGFTRFNIVPGLVAIILTMTGIMMTALAMTRERERGTMENLLAMPIAPLEVMVGKISPYVFIGFFQAVLILAVAKLLYGIPILGSLMFFFAATAIFLTCNIALGFTISTVAENQTQAMQMAILVLLPSILLSGFIFPFEGMPWWAQAIGSIIPATHFIEISRGIMLKGAGVAELWPQIWPLLLFMVVITLVAMRSYKQTLD